VKTRIRLALWILPLLVLAIAVPFTTTAFPGFHDYPGDSCLGPGDPFCAGGGGGHCWNCSFVYDTNTGQLLSASCTNGSGGKQQCNVDASGGTVNCSTSGPSC